MNDIKIPCTLNCILRHFKRFVGTIGGALPPILHKVEVPFIGKKDCESWFDDGDRHQDIEPVFICAGYKNGGRDACQVKKPNSSRNRPEIKEKHFAPFRVIPAVRLYRKWTDAGVSLVSFPGALDA